MAEQTQAKPKLVIDANVIIKNPNLHELMLAYQLYTVPAVVSEIKDVAARARFTTVSSQIKIESPNKAATDAITQFAKKTGDFISLSSADFQVIALGYQKIAELGKVSQLHTEPQKASNYKKTMPGDGTEAGEDSEESSEEAMEEPNTQTGGHKDESEENKESDNRDGEGEKIKAEQGGSQAEDLKAEDQEEETTNDADEWISVEKTKKQTSKPHRQYKKSDDASEISKESETVSSKIFTKSVSTDKSEDVDHPQLWYQNKDFAPEDEEGWIKPSNLTNVMQGTRVGDSETLAEMGVGIMTADFAMQNIILQMGIPLISVDGMAIKQLKSYILECYSCYQICRDTTKQFCPVCGNMTLLKVTCSFNNDGSFVLYRRKNYKVNTRGTRYAIPNPKGGQRNNDLILAEDMMDSAAIQRKVKKRERYNKEQFEKADQAYQHGMGFDDIKKQNKHFPTFQAGYGRHNPNESAYWKKRGGKK